MSHPPPSSQNSTQSLHFESNEGIYAPPNPLSPAATEEAACIAEDLLTDEWIGVGAHHDRSGLAACGPTDHIARRGVPVHPRRAVGVLRDGGLLPVLRPGIGGRGEERPKAQRRRNQSNRNRCPADRHVILHRFPIRVRQIWRPSPTQASRRSSHLRVGGCSSSSLRADAIVRRYWVALAMSRTRLRAGG